MPRSTEFSEALRDATPPAGMETRIAQRLAGQRVDMTADASLWRGLFARLAMQGPWLRGAITGVAVASLAFGAVLLLVRPAFAPLHHEGSMAQIGGSSSQHGVAPQTGRATPVSVGAEPPAGQIRQHALRKSGADARTWRDRCSITHRSRHNPARRNPALGQLCTLTPRAACAAHRAGTRPAAAGPHRRSSHARRSSILPPSRRPTLNARPPSKNSSPHLPNSSPPRRPKKKPRTPLTAHRRSLPKFPKLRGSSIMKFASRTLALAFVFALTNLFALAQAVPKPASDAAAAKPAQDSAPRPRPNFDALPMRTFYLKERHAGE